MDIGLRTVVYERRGLNTSSEPYHFSKSKPEGTFWTVVQVQMGSLAAVTERDPTSRSPSKQSLLGREPERKKIRRERAANLKGVRLGFLH